MTDLPRHLSKPRLNPQEASEYLEAGHGLTVKVSTLKFWRCRKRDYGPPFAHSGRSVVYRRLALDAWAMARLGEPSTVMEGDHA